MSQNLPGDLTMDGDRSDAGARNRGTRRVLITGATGLLGRAAIAALTADGDRIRAAVRRSPYPTLGGDIEIVQHPDLRQPFDWRPLLDGIEIVIHLAGMERKLRASSALYDHVNHLATARLAAAAAQAGIRHFIFASCLSAQNGCAADHALTELDPAAPTDPQGRSKLAAEAALRASGAPFTILRLAPVYGPGMTGGLAFLLRAALSRVPLPVRDLTNRRSYLGIDNFISALRFLISSPAASNEVYLLADPGIPPSLADLVRTIRQAKGRRAFLLPSQMQYAEIPLRLIRLGRLWDRYCGNLRVDSSKLIAAGWQPVYDARTGIFRLMQNSGAALRRVTPPGA